MAAVEPPSVFKNADINKTKDKAHFSLSGLV